MHRWIFLAAIVIALCAVAVWVAHAPVKDETYAASLRNSKTGAIVECYVRGPEQDRVPDAYEVCMMACGSKGFVQIPPATEGSTVIAVLTSSPEETRRLWKSNQFLRFIPAACRGA